MIQTSKYRYCLTTKLGRWKFKVCYMRCDVFFFNPLQTGRRVNIKLLALATMYFLSVRLEKQYNRCTKAVSTLGKQALDHR